MKLESSLQPQKEELPSEWIERHFYVPEPRDVITGDYLPPGPLQLAEHQRRIIDEALSKNERGLFNYSTIIYSAPKKSGKSAVASAVNLYMADKTPYARCYCLANDGKQSSDRIYGPIYTCLQLHNRLGGKFKGVVANKTEVILPNMAKIEAIPVDPSGEAGGNPTVVTLSEVWGYDTDIKKRFFTEMTVPPTLYGRAIRWIETYAGYVGISDLLWNLYQRGVVEGQQHPDFPDLPVYVNKDAGMFVYWDHEPRMIWQTPEYYVSEANVLSYGEFERIHRNRWVSPTESFVDRGAWNACADPTLMPLNDNKTPAVLAIDAAVSHDCAAAILVTRDPKYPDTDIAIRRFAVWKPENGKILLEQTIGKTIQEWGLEYNIACVTYDPYQMEKLAQDYSRGIVLPSEAETRGMTQEEILAYKDKLRRAVMRWYKPFNQNNERSVADKRLYDMIVARQIHYNPDNVDPIAEHGDDETLTKHITQAGASGKADKYRLVKLAETAKIDGAVALSMAVHVCMSLNLHNREYDEKDLLRRYDRGEINYDQMMDGFKRRDARVRAE